jgi:hypothetical protein
MLNLWSQVGRVGCSCRCPSCLTTKHALVRRVSTAIGRMRARPKTSSTFLYSAIFAAATVTDGHFKRQRRAHWDDAIQKAQKQLEATQRAVKEHPDQFVDENTGSEKNEPRSVKIQYEELDFDRQPGYEQQDNHIKLMDVTNVLKYAPKPGAPRPPAPRTTESNYYPSRWGAEWTAPQSLWSGEIRRAKAYERRWSKKKIAKAELAAARLAVTLTMLIDLESQTMINLVVLPEAVREIARLSRAEQRQLLYDLKSDLINTDALESWETRRGNIAKMTIPYYSQREDNSHYPIVEELNESILGLITAYKNEEIHFKALVVKICHNLLVSPAPPDLQTINILLLGFYSLDQKTYHRHAVIDAVLHFCRTVKVRPNEITCAAILSSFIKRNMPDKFAEFIALMRAADGTRGLMLAKPEIRITETSQGRLIPHDEIKGKVFQAVNPSALVFWQVVRGVLKFSGIQEAIEICKNFGKLAWGLDRTCLLDLLMRCVKEQDWESGIWVWEQVQIFHRRHKVDLGGIIGAMLALCLKCNEKGMFEEIFQEALEQKYKLQVKEATPVILTDLAEKALRTAAHFGQVDGEEENQEVAREEVDTAQDGELEETRSSLEIAQARYVVGMGMKSLNIQALQPDALSAEYDKVATGGSGFSGSTMWFEESEAGAASIDPEKSSQQRSPKNQDSEAYDSRRNK